MSSTGGKEKLHIDTANDSALPAVGGRGSRKCMIDFDARRPMTVHGNIPFDWYLGTNTSKPIEAAASLLGRATPVTGSRYEFRKEQEHPIDRRRSQADRRPSVVGIVILRWLHLLRSPCTKCETLPGTSDTREQVRAEAWYERTKGYLRLGGLGGLGSLLQSAVRARSVRYPKR